MRTHATIGGSDLLLGVIAIRLAVLVVVGWGLTLLPQQVRSNEIVCAISPAAKTQAQAPARMIGPRVVHATLADMLRHD